METVIMIVIDLKLDNFKAFRNFHLNMSYLKKVVHSTIVDECLKGRTNFRYKKLNILMGGNATGKTSLGRVMADIFCIYFGVNISERKAPEERCENNLCFLHFQLI